MILQMSFPFEENVEFELTFHDPQFFWQTYNGLTIPKASFTVSDRGETYLVLHATSYHKLNRENDQCEEKADYSFTSCVKVNTGKEKTRKFIKQSKSGIPLNCRK